MCILMTEQFFLVAKNFWKDNKTSFVLSKGQFTRILKSKSVLPEVKLENEKLVFKYEDKVFYMDNDLAGIEKETAYLNDFHCKKLKYSIKNVFDKEDIKKLNIAKEFTSLDEIRRAMQGIFINSHIVATDGHRLVHFNKDNPLKKVEFVLNPLVVEIANILGVESFVMTHNETVVTKDKRKDAEGKVIVDKTSTFTFKFVFEDSNIELYQKEYGTKYPEWKGVIPEEPRRKGKIIFNKQEVSQKITEIQKFLGTESAKIRIGEEKAEFRKGTWEDGTNGVVENYGIVKNEEFKPTAFNTAYMKDIFKHIESEEVEIVQTDNSNTKACIVNNNFLLMPVIW